MAPGPAVYTASVIATDLGRAGGTVKAEDGFQATMALPKGLGGKGVSTAKGANPEVLFAAGYATCFMGALQLTAAQRKLTLPRDVTVRAVVELHKADDVGFSLATVLRVHAKGLSQTQADELVRAAHDVCPYSKAVRASIPVRLLAVVT